MMRKGICKLFEEQLPNSARLLNKRALIETLMCGESQYMTSAALQMFMSVVRIKYIYNMYIIYIYYMAAWVLR